MSSRSSRNWSSALLSILFGWLFLAGLVSPSLHGSIPRDRHPTVELPTLIEGPPAAERVASAFPPARLELGLSEGDAAILHRVLVRQNPWSKFDPEGLSGWQVNNQNARPEHRLTNPEYRKGYMDSAGKELLAGTVATLTATGVGAFVGPALGTSVAAGYGTAAISNAAGGYVANGVANKMDGQSFHKNAGTAIVVGAACGIAFHGVIGESVPSKVTEPAPPKSPSAGSARSTTVETQAEVKTYHRLGDSPETVTKIQESAELWGRPPRNMFGSDIPKAKAYEGPLPEGASGFEFRSSVPPDGGSVPGKPTWSGQRPGVVTENGWAKIKVEVTKDTVTPKPSTTASQN